MSFQFIQQLPRTSVQNVNGITSNSLTAVNANGANASEVNIQSPLLNPTANQVNFPPASTVFVANNTIQGPTDIFVAPTAQPNLSAVPVQDVTNIMIPSAVQTMPMIPLANQTNLTNLTPMDIQRIINMNNLNNGKQNEV